MQVSDTFSASVTVDCAEAYSIELAAQAFTRSEEFAATTKDQLMILNSVYKLTLPTICPVVQYQLFQGLEIYSDPSSCI
jgi:hypothetical protein